MLVLRPSRPRLVVVLTLFSLLLTSTSFARGPYPAWDWIEHYYENPQPEKFITSIYELSRNGYFELPGHTVLAMGFIASVFRDNPNQLDEWLLYCRSLPDSHKRLIVSALWCSGHPKGEEYLRFYAQSVVGPRMASRLLRTLDSSPPLYSQTIDSSRVVYFRWGAFLATGNVEALDEIFLALNTIEGLTASDRWWVARKASLHQDVVAHCRAELDRAPSALRESMETVIISADLTESPSS